MKNICLLKKVALVLLIISITTGSAGAGYAQTPSPTPSPTPATPTFSLPTLPNISFTLPVPTPTPTPAAGKCCAGCPGEVTSCSSSCSCISDSEKKKTIEHLKQEFIKHREWFVKEVFEKHLLPALMLFAEQMTAMAMHQVVVVGAFLDAKHQLETQRLFQELMAQAHKDYQPSEGMCTFGTVARSLAASDRNMDLSAMAVSNRTLQRELLSGNALGGNGNASDYLSRINQFRELYCNTNGNGIGLSKLCTTTSKDPGRMDNDVNFTNVVDSPLTLKLDFTSEGDTDHSTNKHVTTVSADEEDLFALAANLYAHNVSPTIAPSFLTDEKGNVIPAGVNHYMNIRAIAAKRSVARNSFAAIAAMKSQGEKEVKPYLHAIIKEMGVADSEEITKYLGDRPSYYAQMEILTKKIYQNPMFYTELYDKPANVERKAVSMQAIELMQRRDMYRSILRAEQVLSVMLETALTEKQEQVVNELNRVDPNSPLVKLPK